MAASKQRPKKKKAGPSAKAKKSKQRKPTCGDAGGRTKAGKPCGRAPASPEGLCSMHRKDKPSKPGPEGRTLTDEEITKLEALASVLTVPQIGMYFGFHEATFRRMCKRDDRILRAYEKGKMHAIATVAGNLVRTASDREKPNVTAMIFYLKTQAGWREQHEEDTWLISRLQSLDFSKLSSEQIEQIERADTPNQMRRVLKLIDGGVEDDAPSAPKTGSRASANSK